MVLFVEFARVVPVAPFLTFVEGGVACMWDSHLLVPFFFGFFWGGRGGTGGDRGKGGQGREERERGKGDFYSDGANIPARG